MKLHNQEMECFGYWVVPCSWNSFLQLFFLFVFLSQLLKISETTVIYTHDL